MWHVYNRGVDKRIIFEDDQDYSVFLNLLKYALMSPEKIEKVDSSLFSCAERYTYRRQNFYEQVELRAYCLMPNHFHLLLYQYSDRGISGLMRSVATGYSVYFNKKYKRSGVLFQGRYKGSCIEDDSYWWHIVRYIHLNGADSKEGFKNYPYSSYRNYVGKEKSDWLEPEWWKGSFDSPREIEEFHSGYLRIRSDLKGLPADS